MSMNLAVGMIPEWTLADRLRKARESAGYEQGKFSEATGIARGTISAAERGHRTPIKANLKVWAMATGVPLIWLETGEGPSDDGPSGKLLHLDSNQEPIGSESSGESNVLRVQFGRRAEDEMQRAA